MRNGFKYIGLAAFAALSLTAIAIQEGVVLKRVAKVGDAVKYRMKADMDMAGMPVSFSALISEKVTKIADNGDITTTSQQSEMKVKVGDQEIEPPSQGAQTTITTASGKVLSITADQTDPNMYRMGNMQAMRFPDKALKVGDSWDVTIPKDDKGSVEAKGTYKIEAQEKVGDIDTFRIKGALKETGGQDPASIDGTFWISIKDGNLVKMQGTFTNAPLPQIGPTTMKVEMHREG
jgi:hypothetical protein